MNVYCIYDKVAKEPGPLFEARNDAVACRMLRQMVKNTPELINDYEMYQVGDWYSESLSLLGLQERRRLVEVSV